MLINSTNVQWYTQHPARTMPIEALFQGLDREVQDGFVRKQTKDDLEIYTYTQECVTNGHWNEFTMMSRGLVVSRETKCVVATPFIKFFNWNEISFNGTYIEKLLRDPGEISMKCDGSLGIVFNWKNKWNVCTKGSFDGEQATWANEYLHNYIDTKELNPKHTYCAEIIYPENRIVVNYGDKTSLVLLAIFDEHGYELSRKDLEDVCNRSKFEAVKLYDFKYLDELLSKRLEIDMNEEGWVLRHPCGLRLKVKGEEYLRAHKAVFNLTPLAIWEEIRTQSNYDELYKGLPVDFAVKREEYRKTMLMNVWTIMNKLETAVERYKHLSNKELGLMKHTIPDQIVREMIFIARKPEFKQEMGKQSRTRDKVFDYFRPNNNILISLSPFR